MNPVKFLSLCGFTLGLLLLFVFLAVSPAPADDWLPIPPADLALKDNPAQPGAHAMILYRRSHIDARQVHNQEDFDEEYMRIKIFTAEGAKEQGRVRIYFSKEDSDIRDLRARTIEPDGRLANFDGQVLEESIATKRGDTVLAKTFTLPDVQPGSIIEYRYRLQYKWESGPTHYLHGQTWIVSGPLFTRDANFSIDPYVPRSSFDPTLNFRTTGLPQGSLPHRQGNGSYTMEIHNIPGIEEEPFMPPPQALQARVEFFYREKGAPVGLTTDQFWNAMGKKWSDEIDKFLSKKSLLDEEVARATAPGDSPEVKLRKLYARAQKIRSLSYEPARSATEKKVEAIKENESVQDLLTRGYATGRQINRFFIGLARAAGFDAAAVYVVPRNRDVLRPAGQDTSPLTADIVWVHAGGKEYWLDPAALYYPFGLLPWPETESKGVRVTSQGAEFVDTPAGSSSDAILARAADLEVSDDGSAKGKLEVRFNGLDGAIRRTANRNEDDAGRRKNLEGEVQSWLPSGSTFELTGLLDWDETAKPLRVEGTVTLPGLGAAAGHRMTVPLALFQTSFWKSFETERRVNPVYFNFREEEVDDVKIRLPQGYKVEIMPPRKIANPGTAVSYEIVPSQAGDGVETKRHLALTDIHYPVDSYDALRSFFNLVKNDDEAQFVLEHSETAKIN
jgi:Domain of Unknown Function with PDB structure (DUF3857)